MLVWRLRSLKNNHHNLALFFSFRRKRRDSDRTLSDAIKNIFGYRPRKVHIYDLAFRHKSVATLADNGHRLCNERLEYLGDAVLGSVVADFLYKKFPYKDEGFLTEMRSRIVSRSTLNMLSRKLGLSSLVQASKESGTQGSSIPGDAFEAFIGAVYLDKGYLFTKKMIIRKIIQTHLDVDEMMEQDINFKSKVIEWAQKEKKTVGYKLADERDNGKRGKLYTIELEIDRKVAGHGTDYSIKKAEQHASRMAWEHIAGNSESS